MKFSPGTYKDAKDGQIIRFIHNMGDGMVYWLQRTLKRRLTKYKTAEGYKSTKNRFIVGNLSIISHWGVQQPLPETLTINLTPDAAWSIGTEIDLPSLKDDELALGIEPGDILCDNIEDDNDVARD